MAGESCEIEAVGVTAEDYTNENGYSVTKYGSAEFTLKKGGKGWGACKWNSLTRGYTQKPTIHDIQSFDGAYKED